MSAKIVKALRALAQPVVSLVPDPRNAKAHDERNIQVIMASLERYGQCKPLVVQVPGNIVRVGNGTLEAARRLGWDSIACVRLQLTDAQATMLALVDNRSQELSSFDMRKLADKLMDLEAEGVPLGSLGWAEYELAPLREAEWDKSDTQEPEPTPDDADTQAIVWSLSEQDHAAVVAAMAKARTRDDTMTDAECAVAIAAAYAEGWAE